MFETHRGWFGNGNNVFRTLNVGDVKTRRVTALKKMDKKENFCVTTKIPYSMIKVMSFTYMLMVKIFNLLKKKKKKKFFLLHKLENMLSVQLDCTEL